MGLLAQAVFVIPVTDAQVATIPTGSRVEVQTPSESVWEAWITGHESTLENGTDLVLTASPDSSDTGAICGEACDEVSVDPAGILLRSRVITVERVDSLVVPSAAVTTTTEGATVVLDEHGQAYPVQVLAGARGITAVDGVSSGMRVRAPAGTVDE